MRGTSLQSNFKMPTGAVLYVADICCYRSIGYVRFQLLWAEIQFSSVQCDNVICIG